MKSCSVFVWTNKIGFVAICKYLVIVVIIKKCFAFSAGQFEEFLKKFENLFDEEEIKAAGKDFHFLNTSWNENL